MANCTFGLLLDDVNTAALLLSASVTGRDDDKVLDNTSEARPQAATNDGNNSILLTQICVVRLDCEEDIVRKKNGKNEAEEARERPREVDPTVSSNTTSRNLRLYSIVEIDFPIFFILFVVRGSRNL